jgi:GTP cyclohydrolase II
MSLLPSITEHLARARADLRMGLPVILRAGQTRLLVAAAETLDPQRLRDMQALGRPALAITAHRAATLKARVYDGDMARLKLPTEADAALVNALADPARDLTHPMKGPFAEIRDDDADLSRIAIRLVKSARLLPAAVTLALPPQADLPGLAALDAHAVRTALARPVAMRPVVSARVPLMVSEAGRLHVFRPEDGGEEHYAVQIGRPDRDAPVLVRLHSACFTGDLLGSLKCDCGPQLRAALEMMGHEGTGVLLYLNQEGRGIGLANKMRAYSLQDQGFDTVEANHRLGFEDDERDFRICADILEQMGIGKVRLLTNNPAKVEMLRGCGIEVTERVPLKVGLNPLNARYLDTKAKKSGHIL